MSALGVQDVLAAIESGLSDWRKLAQPLVARFRSADAVSAAEFAAAVTREAAAFRYEIPDIRLGPGCVDVTLYTVHAESGRRQVTDEELDRARAISALAKEYGLRAVPGEVTQIELVLDAPSVAASGPFWAALLTGDPGNTPVLDTIFDPTNRVPSTWFQRTEIQSAPRQRWHVDLWLAPEAADGRIAAALAAGGTVFEDSHAPSYTVLADPDGNRVCVCTAFGRT
ncbi:4a-hydroxytetrahydrobiopterin dehydratase [Streptomyces sp. MUM 136J]|uniref:VOC family protein n=1 Tax=Streptomyces sp. MUM 136J TaxID=2791992 RepID=UPI001F045CB5|nr:VOC family protein [Streptomyces sp. MUM 136J]MCH0570797.1 4a-hydroxytetrahydrobiopterin dehydratase [Streptomyces sp. MUM 136J]